MRLLPSRSVATLCAAAMLCLAGCGVSAGPPTITETLSSPALQALPPTPSDARVSRAAQLPASPSTAGAPQARGATPDPALASPSTGAATSDARAITETFHTFGYLLAGLDDNLNAAWLPPLAEVTTERLAQAVTRQASAMLHAHEHGVGTLEGRNLTIKMTGAASAALAECEDYADFYLVQDSAHSPDPGIVRGDFVGTAQLLKIGGRWYVDVYATTQTACSYQGAPA